MYDPHVILPTAIGGVAADTRVLSTSTFLRFLRQATLFLYVLAIPMLTIVPLTRLAIGGDVGIALYPAGPGIGLGFRCLVRPGSSDLPFARGSTRAP